MHKIKENKPFYLIRDLKQRLEKARKKHGIESQGLRKLIDRAQRYLDKHDTDALRSLPWKPAHFAKTAEEELAWALSNIDLTNESEEEKQARRLNLIQAHIRDFYREVQEPPSKLAKLAFSLASGLVFGLGAVWGANFCFHLFG